MKLGIVVYSNDSETVWNAFRFANAALAMNDGVRVFLIGKGVEHEGLDTPVFNISEQVKNFVDGEGKVFICGTCLNIRQKKAPGIFTVATLKELYDIVAQSDKVVTF